MVITVIKPVFPSQGRSGMGYRNYGEIRMLVLRLQNIIFSIWINLTFLFWDYSIHHLVDKMSEKKFKNAHYKFSRLKVMVMSKIQSYSTEVEVKGMLHHIFPSEVPESQTF